MRVVTMGTRDFAAGLAVGGLMVTFSLPSVASLGSY
jgi:hypothetical protein